MHQVTNGHQGWQNRRFQQQAECRFDLGFGGGGGQVQDADILLVGSLGPIGEKPIIGQAEGGRGKEFIAVLVGGEGSRLAYQRPDDMVIIDAMLVLPNEARQDEHRGGAHVALKGFRSHANHDRRAYQAGRD